MGKVKTVEEKKWRHGDVYGIASTIDVTTLKTNGKKIVGAESNILAYGEVTGHKHELDCEPTQFQRYEMEGKKYLVVFSEGGVAIKHAEHGIGIIPIGVWEERIDREFDYLTHEYRPVGD